MPIDLTLMMPEVILFSLAFVVLGLDLVLGPKHKIILTYTALLGLLAAFVTALAMVAINNPFLLTANESFSADGVTSVFRLGLLGLSFLVVLASLSSLSNHPSQGEYYVLLLFSLGGAVMLAGSAELITLLLSVELMALPAYSLVAFRKNSARSNEAALKYFILGLLASAIIIYAMSLLYGLTGETHISRIAAALAGGGSRPALLLASLLFLGGFGFKVAAIPFHFWAPDAYEGASPQIAAYLAAVAKMAAFAALIRIFFGALPAASVHWSLWFGILATVTMIGGAFMALPQRNVKRLLAYSSISHAGYILIGLAVPTQLALSSMLFYVIVYALASAGSFFVVVAVSRTYEAENVEDYAGLSQRNPALALAMTIFLLSLLGIPPLAGFWGKLYMVSAAIRGGAEWLAVVAILISVVSIGYYVKIIKEMYLVEPREDVLEPASGSLRLAVYGTLALVIVLLYNAPLFDLAERAAQTYPYLESVSVVSR